MIRGLKINKFDFPDTWYSKIFDKPVLLVLLGVGAVVFIITSLNRYVYIDDAFFGEQSYWLAKSGVVKIPSMIDFLGSEVQLFSYHKLHIFVGAILIKFFGWGITPLRLTNLLFCLALVFVFYKYYKFEKKTFSSSHYWIATFVLIFTPQIYLYAYTFRPEIWVTFFGFVSYFFLNRFFKEGRSRFVVIAGLFAGLAFFTHLNGLIFPVAGFVVLLIQRKHRALFFFSIIAGLVCSFYLWDLIQGENFSTWLYQLQYWPNNNSPNYFKEDFFSFVKGLLIKLSQEHQRFFWSPKVWVISIFFILSFVFNFKYLIKNHRILFIYIVTLIITQNIAGSQIAERYLLYYYPFFAIIIAIDVVRLINEKANVRKVLYIMLFVLQVGFVGKMFSDIIEKNKFTIQYYDATLAKIPDTKSRILVPHEMFFNGLAKYNLVSYKGFEYYQVRINHKLTQAEFFERAAMFSINFIVVPESVLISNDKSVPCLNNGIIEQNPYYKEFYRDDKTLILKRI